MSDRIKDHPPLRVCPFCGEYPFVRTWHGGGPRKRLITCGNDWCDVGPGVTGSTIGKAVRSWNERPIAGMQGPRLPTPEENARVHFGGDE